MYSYLEVDGFQWDGGNFLMMAAFWDIAPRNLAEVDQRITGAYCLHHQGDETAAREMSGKEDQ
jgi:hypothetical protein